MYCILVTGPPAAGKSTMARDLSERLGLPAFSKDSVKELLFDRIGFGSREEKNRLGAASMEILCYTAEQLMKSAQPFILESNFEFSSREGITALLRKYGYAALTLTLTGDYRILYERFLKRQASPDRHRGHVVNDRYPEAELPEGQKPPLPPFSWEGYLYGIVYRGFDSFRVDGQQIRVDTTDFSGIEMEGLTAQIKAWRDTVSHEGAC